MTDKTREQMIEDASIYAADHGQPLNGEWLRGLFDAALATRKPAYPTQESIRAAGDALYGVCRPDDGTISNALLAADEHNPIVQAAIELVRELQTGRSYAVRPIIEAMKNAGKL